MDAMAVLREIAAAWRNKACDQDFARACSARGLEMDRLAAELLAAAETELPPMTPAPDSFLDAHPE